MGRALLDSVEDYDADTMTLLGRAFNSAWQDIAGNFDTGGAQRKTDGTRLALIILELAKGGERDEDAITAAAVKIMSFQTLRNVQRLVTI